MANGYTKHFTCLPTILKTTVGSKHDYPQFVNQEDEM